MQQADFMFRGGLSLASAASAGDQRGFEKSYLSLITFLSVVVYPGMLVAEAADLTRTLELKFLQPRPYKPIFGGRGVE